MNADDILPSNFAIIGTDETANTVNRDSDTESKSTSEIISGATEQNGRLSDMANGDIVVEGHQSDENSLLKFNKDKDDSEIYLDQQKLTLKVNSASLILNGSKIELQSIEAERLADSNCDKMLPFDKKETTSFNVPVTILGIDLTHRPKWVQFCVLSLGVFVFYIGYGYVQELIFQLDGMKPFGLYLTFVQFLIYSLFAFTEGRIHHDPKRRIPLRTYIQIAIYTVATMALSNASVGYLNYPTQVIFKCCKLIPVLIGGIIIQGKKYGLLDLLSACLMSAGLIIFILGDSEVSPNFDIRGYVMISFALLADAVIGNVQEKAMRTYGATNNEVVLYSYTIGSVYIFVGLLISGQLVDAFMFFLQNPWKTYGYAVVFGTLGYLGVNVVLSLVRTSGALLAVTVTTVRKAITIVVSFVMFAKPFTSAYLWGGSIVMLSIYLNLYNKNRLKWDPIIRKWIDYVTGADRIQRPTFKTTEVL